MISECLLTEVFGMLIVNNSLSIFALIENTQSKSKIFDSLDWHAC